MPRPVRAIKPLVVKVGRDSYHVHEGAVYVRDGRGSLRRVHDGDPRLVEVARALREQRRVPPVMGPGPPVRQTVVHVPRKWWRRWVYRFGGWMGCLRRLLRLGTMDRGR